MMAMPSLLRGQAESTVDVIKSCILGIKEPMAARHRAVPSAKLVHF